jgi:hypothetical protein
MKIVIAMSTLAGLIGCRPDGRTFDPRPQDPGPFTTVLDCPLPPSLPFVIPDTGWRDDRNEAASVSDPRIKHQPADIMAVPGGAIAYTDLAGDAALETGNFTARGIMARSKQNQGLFGFPIPGEQVSVWEYSEVTDWQMIADGTTEAGGSSNPGAYELDTGSPEISADLVTRYAILSAEGSCGTHIVVSMPAGRQAVITDIDETLTLSDEEIFEQISDPSYDPLLKTSSVEVMQAWASKGYHVIYLTARPHQLRTETRRWLEDHGYPAGPMITAPDFVFDDTARVYKGAWVNRVLGDLGWDLVAAYGNAESDIDAYEDAGIDKSVTFIVGPNAGANGTEAIQNDDFSDHLTDYVAQQPDANHL